MRIKSLLAVVAVGFLLAAQAKDDGDKEKKALEGTWKVVSAEAGGKAVEADKLKDAAIVIKGDKLIMADKGKDGKELTFKLDPSKKPKQIDLTDPKEKDSKAVPCIYSIDGDDLKLCIPLVPPGKKDEAKRPDSFDTKDKPLMTITAKREKK